MTSIFMRSITNQKGNIFAVLFGAVALTGALAAISMQTITGPISSATKISQKNLIANNLSTNAKIVQMNALSLTNKGDIDNDSFVEPHEYVPDGTGGCSITFTGGGCLPDGLGLSSKDAYNTPYAYCVWDHGATDNGHADGAAAAPYRLNGNTDMTSTVTAIISAGPDKTFQTSCAAYDGAGTDGVVTTSGSDDIVIKHNYMQASASIGGLWVVKESDNTTAEIRKNLEIQDEAGTVTASILSETGDGRFLGVTTDRISSPASTNMIEVHGHLNLSRADAPDGLGYVTIDQVGQYGAERGILIRTDGDADASNNGIMTGTEDAPIYIRTAASGNPADAETVFGVWGNGELYIKGLLDVGRNTPDGDASPGIVHLHSNGAPRLIMDSENHNNTVQFMTKLGSDDESLGSGNPSNDNKGWQMNTLNTSSQNLGFQYWDGPGDDNGGWTSHVLDLAPNGNIGFGTDTPLEKVHVEGALAFGGDNLYFRHDGATDANNDYIYFDDGNNRLYTGSGGMLLLLGDTNRGNTNWQTPDNGFSAHSVYIAEGMAVNQTTASEALEVTGTIRAVNTIITSDARFKEAIRPLQERQDGLDMVNALKPVSYHWKDNELGADEQIGFLAQDVETILPELVGGTDERKAVDYVHMIPILTKAIQEQDEMIADNKQRIETLKQRISTHIKQHKTRHD